MQVVVEIGRFVKGEVSGNRLLVNETGDVVLDQLGLGGADPVNHGAQQLREEQDNSHQERRPEDRMPVAAGADPGDDSIDERPRQIDGRDRQKSLHQEQAGQRDGPARRGSPDQTERAGEVSQLNCCATKADDRVF